MIQLKNITKTYIGKNVTTQALKGISISISSGEYICLHGKSGCGKSTLLNIIGGMDIPTTGQYLYNNMEVGKFSFRELAYFRNREVGYVFQSFHLLPTYTALENVAMPLVYRGVRKKIREDRARAALERVNLSEKRENFPSELSGGEQQRVAIARSIVHEPSLLLCDEPTGNLDEQNAKQIIEIIEAMRSDTSTLIVVTHDHELQQRADRQIRIQDGVLTEETQSNNNYRVNVWCNGDEGDAHSISRG